MARDVSRIKKTIYLACEGGDIGTEASYITNICNLYDCSYVFVYKKSADPETLAARAIDFSERNRWLSKKSELWVIFDNDDHDKVKVAYKKIDDFNKSLKRGCTPINIAFNAPTIETWGLLCCRVKSIPNTKKECQSLLHEKMPSYIYKTRSNEKACKPYFDMKQMEEGCSYALQRAKNWQQSAIYSQEYDISPFAGIYKLVEHIKQ